MMSNDLKMVVKMIAGLIFIVAVSTIVINFMINNFWLSFIAGCLIGLLAIWLDAAVFDLKMSIESHNKKTN